MTRQDPSKEPARKTPYRRLQTKLYSFRDDLARHDSCIGYLLAEIRALQKRVEQLEKRNESLAASLAAAALRELRRVEQRGDLSVQEYGGQTVGRVVGGAGD